MGQSSQAGHLILRKQSVKGTYAADLASAGIALRVKSGALAPNRDLIVADAEIGGGRDVADAYMGAVSWSGDFEFYARMESLPTLLQAALGTASSAVLKNRQTLTPSGTISGGTFTLTYAGQTTAAIAYNATAAAIATALVALSNIGPGEVTGSGGPVNTTPVTLTFSGTLADNTTLLTINDSLLTGTTPDIAVAAVVDTPYIHSFTPSDAATLPFYSLEHKVGAGLEVYNYTDVVVNTLHLEADANGYLMGTIGLIAIKETAGNTPTAGVASLADTSAMIVGTNINVLYNALTLPAKSFSIDINNNFEDDDFRLGSLYLNQLSPKRREVTAGVTIRPEDSALWRQAVYGSSVATEAAGTTVKQALSLVASTYESIPSSSPASPYQLKLDMPKVALKPYALEPSGDDLIENDIEMQALRPDPAVPLATVSVRNSKVAVA